MRTVILERIEVIEKTHGLFALVREHQLEVRESLPRVKPGLFHYHGTFNSVVGHVPPRNRMEGQACQKCYIPENFFHHSASLAVARSIPRKQPSPC